MAGQVFQLVAFTADHILHLSYCLCGFLREDQDLWMFWRLSAANAYAVFYKGHHFIDSFHPYTFWRKIHKANFPWSSEFYHHSCGNLSGSILSMVCIASFTCQGLPAI